MTDKQDLNQAPRINEINFLSLGLSEPVLTALRESGYTKPTPIQSSAIPHVLQEKDLLGIAQTGTGKTAAFCLPIIELLEKKKKRTEAKMPRALILTPTRELAIQIHENLVHYGKHLKQKYAVIFGGVGQGNQVRDMSYGVDVLVATPGRLLDLIDQRYIKIDKVEFFVLDEADRMLDMGFMKDIQVVLDMLPEKKQSLFFSATMPKEISDLAHTILNNPEKVEVTPQATTVEKIKQSVYFVEKKDKMSLLLNLLKDNNLYKVLVFVEMKHFANKVVDKLTANRITSAAIHGNKSQGARQRAIEDFAKDKVRVLVATDIASRGIDIDGITHVINFELPHLPENYVHRIGRTARAGQEGEAISFCCGDERSYLFAIEKTTRQSIAVVTDHPLHSEAAAKAQITSVGKAKARIESTRPKPERHKRGPGFGPKKKKSFFKRKRD
jgi:ATP-dependent RNA helicase RhlE